MRTGMRFIGKPFSITGRTGRKGFWRFVFFYAVVMTALAVGPFSGRLLVNAFIFGLTLLLVLSAVRRLRDTGMSGWLVLLLLAPVAGAIALIGLLARPGMRGAEDPPAAGPGVVRGAVEGWREILRFCGAVAAFLVLFIGWLGQALNGPITQHCRRCHRRIYPGGALYCDNCLPD